MQAVFLTEVLSHFTAKRAPNGLSEVFLAMYDQVRNEEATELAGYRYD